MRNSDLLARGRADEVRRAGSESGLYQDHVARGGAGDPIQGAVRMARSCMNCDNRKAMTRVKNKAFTITHAGMRTRVDGLSGWRCAAAIVLALGLASAGARADDLTPPDVVYPELAAHAADAAGVAPAGWQVETKLSGDLNGEQIDGLVLVL